MRYIHVKWKHNFPDEPTVLVSEIDDERWEHRKIEIYADGRMGYADGAAECGDTRLSIEPLPVDSEIRADPQFELREISKEEFEEYWSKRA